MIKASRILFLFILCISVMFTSCRDENIDETGTEIEIPTTGSEEVNPLLGRAASNNDGLLMDCFSISYPFELVDEEGGTHTINSESDFDDLFADSIILVDFVYPITITDEEGNTSTVTDGDGLADAFAACLPNGWEELFPAYDISLDNSCYTLAYPVTLVNDAGEETIAADEAALIAAIVDEMQYFVFPINLNGEDGSTHTANSIEELLDILISCSGWEPSDSTGVDWDNGLEYIYCYTTGFPINVITGDGSVVAVNDHMELCDLMLEGDFAGYAFPMTLTDEDGNVIIVNSQAELDAAGNDCPGWWGGGNVGEGLPILFDLLGYAEESDCYTVNFPVTLISEDGDTTTVNSPSDLEQALTNNYIVDAELPIFVTFQDGIVMSVSSFIDLDELITSCQ